MKDDRPAQTRELEKLEQVAEQEDNPERIRQKADDPKPPEPVKAPRFWFVPYLVVAALCGAGILFLQWRPGLFKASLLEKIQRYLIGGFGIVVLLAAARTIDVYLIGRLRNPISRFNLQRVLRLVTGILGLFIVISVLFVNWYAAVVSLGLISLVLGFALQTPISSFIGWIYILLRAPYRVGDRIQIGDARGDVIDVSYLDTTLWEIRGAHLSTDHPSGRLIKFPNTNVFSEPVFNYSWPLFPYIWNEVKFQLAYESDLEFVAQTMQKIVEDQLGSSMMNHVKEYRELLSRTPVHCVDVEERPSVVFRVSDNTWLEAIVRYLVDPKEAGRVKTDLTRKLLAALNGQPERVLFPKSNMR
jgi:small-conductance mechanosensitive channel